MCSVSCLSLIDCDPVCCGKPFMALYIIDSVLQVAITFCQIHLQQVSQQILQVRAEVGGESHLERRNIPKYILLMLKQQVGSRTQKTSHRNIPITSAYLPRHNLLIDLNGLIGKERGVSSCHFIDEDSKGPPVHSFVIALKRYN